MTTRKALSTLVLIVILVSLLTGCADEATLSSSLPSSTSSATSPISTSLIPVPTTTAPTPITSAAVATTTSLTPTPTITNLLTPVALCDMTAYDRYKGEDGGLYGGGMNVPPPAQYSAAQAAMAQIKPLDTSGNPSPAGKVVLISIGMSNTTMEFSVFKSLADADPAKSPDVTIVDGAQGGQTAVIWATQSQPWQVLAQRLQAAGVTPAQVQVVWIKEADAQPSGAFPTEAQTLEGELTTIVQRLKQAYPNVRIAYLSSRIYAGYATTMLNPEPYAYESAFSVRWLIQGQINGDTSLNDNAAAGPVTAPVLLWGPYLWADGMNARSDGLTWQPSDFSSTDGTHPSQSGALKVADMLLNFFTSNELAKGWFLKTP